MFLDDILIFSQTLEEHERHVKLVLDKLRASKLYAKESKCEFFKTEVEFLGHMVGRDGVRMMDDKVQAISEWPTPSKVGDIRAFLGTAGYYRKFIRDFSSIATPLTELTKEAVKFEWTTKQQAAFNQLKSAMQSAPVLALPDPKLPFVVHVDASGFATGAVLQQDQGKGLQPIAYLSKKMLDAETRYPVHEQELLGIIVALKAWRHHLMGSKFKITIMSDHKSLTQFKTQPQLSGRQARWQYVLAPLLRTASARSPPCSPTSTRRTTPTSPTAPNSESRASATTRCKSEADISTTKEIDSTSRMTWSSAPESSRNAMTRQRAVTSARIRPSSRSSADSTGPAWTSASPST